MQTILNKFEYLPDVTDKIDQLVADAHKTRGRKEKSKMLSEAQELADAYTEHCAEGGNDKATFIKISES